MDVTVTMKLSQLVDIIKANDKVVEASRMGEDQHERTPEQEKKLYFAISRFHSTVRDAMGLYRG